jgi:DNA-binding SARP family transcriptional activator
VQGYVSGLRKILGAQTIITRPGGYLARVESDRLDAARFESLAAEGRASLPNDPARAVELFDRALRLWRGPPLVGLEFMSVARSETQRLVEAELTAIEQRIEAELVLGHHADLVQQLPKLVAQNPYRERLRAHLMVALYRTGRQAEALAAYRDARLILVSELGMEPSRELQLLHEQILAQDPALESPLPLRAAANRAQIDQQRVEPARRLVTVLAISMHIRGPGVDPESMYRIVERHVRTSFGATVGPSRAMSAIRSSEYSDCWSCTRTTLSAQCGLRSKYATSSPRQTMRRNMIRASE